jgi:hypothetical protein
MGLSEIPCARGHDGSKGEPTCPDAREARIPDAVLDELLAGACPKTVFDPSGLLDALKKAPAERALNAEADSALPMTTAERPQRGPQN